MEHARGAFFLSGALIGVVAQSSIAEADGVAAIAIVSQSGPSRTSIITAKTTSAAVRTSCENGRTRSDMPVS